MDAGTEPLEEESKLNAVGHRLGYFLWRRRAAKCLWLICACFWGGAAISLIMPPLEVFYEGAFAGLLYSVLFPPLVFLYLALGWARQEIDAGRIELGPAEPARDRSVGGWSDPAADPLDPRSPNHTAMLVEMPTRPH